MTNLIEELKQLRERMRCVVGLGDDDIDLVTQAIAEIERLESEVNVWNDND